MGAGHIVDSDTVALWRFDETSHQDYADAADETGNYDASQSTNANKPGILGGPNGVTDYCRWFIGSAVSKSMAFTSDATMQSTLKGDWTFEAWVYVEDFSSLMTLWMVGGDGETEATNYLAEVMLTTGGKLQVFWEQGAGGNVTVTQTAGTSVSIRTWTYIAVTADENAGTTTVNFFINSGTSQDSDSGTTASGGTSSAGTIGMRRSTAQQYWGGVARIRLSDKVRSGTELNNNATASDYSFSNDGDTVALWDFQEAPEVKDVSGSGYHLQPVNAGANQPRITDSLLQGDGGKSRSSISTSEFYVLYQRETFRQVLLGEYTVEWWGRFFGTGLGRGILHWQGTTETEAANALIFMDFDVSAGNYRLHVFWEYGAGVNVESTGSNTIVSDTGEGATDATTTHHYAVVFQDAGGGTRNVLMYRDGSLIETLGPLTDPSGGTTTATSDYGLTVLWRDSVLWEGFVDDMRISDKVRTVTEITASYNRGAAASKRTIPALPRIT